VRMQWMMLQQEIAEDFVIATGMQFSVRQFIEMAASSLSMEVEWKGAGLDEVGYCDGRPVIRIDPRYFRPTEVDSLLGDALKAREKLGWVPEISLGEMIAEMAASDLAEARKQLILENNGYEI